MTRVHVDPGMLRWARERAGLSPDALQTALPGALRWEQGNAEPTLRQLERFARLTQVPLGFLFLPAPPREELPIPDMRSPRNARITRPSPNLLETIYLCQQRQDWYREHARTNGEPPLPFVGSLGLDTPVEDAGATIRSAVGLDLEERRAVPTWSEALRGFMRQADALGVLVMCSGVVLNNNRRKLDPAEFRGFALSDEQAPLVFINGADTKAAQSFTLAHELAHIWLGDSALTDSTLAEVPRSRVERWCNRVAAELLVPLHVLESELESSRSGRQSVQELARRFKVSTLVVLCRLRDARRLTAHEFERAFAAESERLQRIPRGQGGDFYLTQSARVSRRFATALVGSALEGETLYVDALRMLGLSKVETFHSLGRHLGYSIG